MNQHEHTPVCFNSHLGAWAIKPDVLESKVSAIKQGLITAKPVGKLPDAPMDNVQIVEFESKASAAWMTYGIIRVDDVMMRHRSKFGGVSTVEIRQQIRGCVGANMDGIIFHINSPGGHIEGQQELLDEVRAAKAVGLKTYAYVSDMACSAAFWLASLCDKIFCGRMALVANIGAYAVLIDSSKAYEMDGLRVVVVRSGENKGLGVDGIPVDDKTVAQAQVEIDTYAKFFVEDVRAHRPKWNGEFADGTCLFPEKAIEIGLVDGVCTFEGLLDALGANKLTEVISMSDTKGTPESMKEQVEVAGEKYDPTEVDTALTSLDDLAEPEDATKLMAELRAELADLADVHAENGMLKTVLEDTISEHENELKAASQASRMEVIFKMAEAAKIPTANRDLAEVEKQLENVLKFGGSRPKVEKAAGKKAAQDALADYKKRYGAIDGGAKFAEEQPELLKELYRETA